MKDSHEMANDLAKIQRSNLASSPRIWTKNDCASGIIAAPTSQEIAIRAAPTPEEITIRIIMDAARLAFLHKNPDDLTVREVVNLCCGIARFLEGAEREMPSIGLRGWKTMVEEMRIYLGPASVDGSQHERP
jgi:hypothetical protein